ncbi:hypothetical protein [Mangrovibrevibacter kandeliae]|uniref:hypothetical protein n=1 Tax=Mangrovibrevibacter kandeliae TaxID=2968473 RepID=UPI0021192ABC|nr:hypothetical protein [Aurantimonas sp. CSK15Z-1]MCQ8780785.1 hypothetical protein [Aurantimonas sp. CSK15Z-1]
MIRSAILVAAAMLASASLAQAQETNISLSVERVSKDHGPIKAIVKVTNDGDWTPRMVMVACAFLDAAGKAVDVGKDSSSRLTPGKTVYQQIKVRQIPR